MLIPKTLSKNKFYYRPHPKDGEGDVFTGMCLSTGGYPSLWSQVWSHVLSLGVDPSQACSWGGGVPQSDPRTGQGYLPPGRTSHHGQDTPLAVTQEDFIVCVKCESVFFQVR